jgi:hypothetical protein
MESSSSGNILAWQALTYTLFGLALAMVVWFARDLFVIGTVLATYTAFIVGVAVMLDHQAAIVSPTDYGILSFRPIASRTYFAVRLTNVFVYTIGLTAVAMWLPIVVTFLRHGGAVGFATAAAVGACATATTLAVTLAYASVLRLAGRAAMERVLSIVQVTMSVLAYGGPVLLSTELSRYLARPQTLPKTFWTLLYPATWFASYLELAAGKRSWLEILPAITSVVVVAAMASQLAGRLSLDYSEHLGAMLTATARVPARRRRHSFGWWFATGEARAVALLVRSQFRTNQRFRMGVLSILPMTVIYLLQAVRGGQLDDPFEGHGMSSFPLTMTVTLIPIVLYTHLTRSDACRASWIFFVYPSDRMRLLRSSKDVLVAFFLVPYLLFVLAIYAYFTGHLFHALVHVVVLGGVGHLMLQLAQLTKPEIPFSRPLQRSGESSNLFGVMILAMILSGIVHAITPWLYGSVPAIGAALVVLLGASVAMDRLIQARVDRQLESLEFQG